jgi:phytoene desaturase
MGGTGALVAALGKLMQLQGIEVRFNTTVAKIDVEKRRAKGVILDDGTRIPADVVVSNADAMYLYNEMLPIDALNASARLKQRSRLSMGLYVLYFGTTKQYPDVAHHTIWFGPRFKEHLYDIFKRKLLTEDFSLYVHRPTATDPSFAPPGCESFYASSTRSTQRCCRD